MSRIDRQIELLLIISLVLFIDKSILDKDTPPQPLPSSPAQPSINGTFTQQDMSQAPGSGDLNDNRGIPEDVGANQWSPDLNASNVMENSPKGNGKLNMETENTQKMDSSDIERQPVKEGDPKEYLKNSVMKSNTGMKTKVETSNSTVRDSQSENAFSSEVKVHCNLSNGPCGSNSSQTAFISTDHTSSSSDSSGLSSYSKQSVSAESHVESRLSNGESDRLAEGEVEAIARNDPIRESANGDPVRGEDTSTDEMEQPEHIRGKGNDNSTRVLAHANSQLDSAPIESKDSPGELPRADSSLLSNADVTSQTAEFGTKSQVTTGNPGDAVSSVFSVDLENYKKETSLSKKISSPHSAAKKIILPDFTNSNGESCENLLLECSDRSVAILTLDRPDQIVTLSRHRLQVKDKIKTAKLCVNRELLQHDSSLVQAVHGAWHENLLNSLQKDFPGETFVLSCKLLTKDKISRLLLSSLMSSRICFLFRRCWWKIVPTDVKCSILCVQILNFRQLQLHGGNIATVSNSKATMTDGGSWLYPEADIFL